MRKDRDSSFSADESGTCLLPLRFCTLFIIYSQAFIYFGTFSVSFGASVVISVEYGGGNGNEREAEADPRLSDAAHER